MELLLVVVSQAAPREFASSQNGQNTTVKCVEVTLNDGINEYIASAFAEKAQKLIDHPLKAGAFIRGSLSFNVRVAKTNDGKEWPVQQVRLNNWGVISEP